MSTNKPKKKNVGSSKVGKTRKPLQDHKPKAAGRKQTDRIVQRNLKLDYTQSGHTQKPPSNTVIVPTQEANYQSQVQVKPMWNPLCVQEMQAALTSYFLTRSIAASPDFLLRLPQFYNGMFTQWVGFTRQVGGTPALSTRLKIVHDLIKGFEQKDVTKHTYTKVSFGWDGIVPPTSGNYPTGWNNWDFVIPGLDDNSYTAPATVHPPSYSEADYSAYLAQIKAISSNRAKFLSVVSDDDPSPLSKDPSAYAKVYPYVGLNPSKSGGFYNDCENEVDILAPILAHNVVYPTTQDDRVAEKLITNEGGPAFNLAPLIPCFNNWFNKNRVDVKFLDMYEVVYTLIYWYLGAVEQAVADGQSVAEFQLPFSQQDFAIVVRQVLLSTFKDQWISQFVGPLAYDNGGATNFLPLQILGNCYGNDQFKRFLSPALLAENLSMLQSVAYRYNKQKSKINETICVPCWGYYDDIQPVFTIPGNEVPTPLFALAADTQKAIKLVDCTISSNTYINANGSYYFSVLEQWNAAITKLKKYINVCDMSNLSPPHNAALLQTTRVFGYVPEKTQEMMRSGALKMLKYPCLAPISNLRYQASLTDVKKGLPTLPQPTNVNLITIQDQYSTYPVQKEFHQLMEYMILPTIRLDPTSVNDVLNKTMYQTITYEGLSQIQNATSNAPAYLSRIQDAANMCVEGAGKIMSSNISALLMKLCQEGNGGVLASLLGGFAKSLVPEASGLIDTIATAVPF